MKTAYFTPEIEIISVENEDIIVTSACGYPDTDETVCMPISPK